MPGFDRTGPLGAGPRTGWGRGLCGPTTGARGSLWHGRGFFGGIGRGGLPWGGGRGRCFGGRGGWFPFGWGAPSGWAPAVPDEPEALRAEIAAAKEEIAALEARLAELEKAQ